MREPSIVIRQLLFMTALLVPWLAYGADPSANLPVEGVRSVSPPPVPAAAQKVGYTTLAIDTNYASYLPGPYTRITDFQGVRNHNDSCNHSAQHAAPGVIWYQGFWYGHSDIIGCRHIKIISEPVAGQNVLDLTLTCDPQGGIGAGAPHGGPCPSGTSTSPDYLEQGSDVVESVTFDGKTAGAGINHGYFEIEYAVVNPSLAPGVWTSGYMWAVQSLSGSYPELNEFDLDETHSDNYEYIFAGSVSWNGEGQSVCSKWHEYGFAAANSTTPIYHKYGELIQPNANGNGYITNVYLDGRLMCGPNQVNAKTQDQLNFLIELIARGCGYKLGDTTCQNEPVIAVSACSDGSGQACLQTPIAMTSTGGSDLHATVAGQTGCPALNGQWPVAFVTSQHIELIGSTYSKSCNATGVINQFDHADMYIKSFRVWSDGYATLLANGIRTQQTTTLH
jgi:hypothetical protein